MKKELEEKEKERERETETYTIDASEKAERKQWIEYRQRHLIEKDLIRVDTYVNEIVDALLALEIDSI